MHLSDLLFLRAGLGWGGMPMAMVARDIAEGRLVEIEIEDAPRPRASLAMSAAYRADTPPGPAGRWFIEQLRSVAARCPNNAMAEEASLAAE